MKKLIATFILTTACTSAFADGPLFPNSVELSMECWKLETVREGFSLHRLQQLDFVLNAETLLKCESGKAFRAAMSETSSIQIKKPCAEHDAFILPAGRYRAARLAQGGSNDSYAAEVRGMDAKTKGVQFEISRFQAGEQFEHFISLSGFSFLPGEAVMNSFFTHFNQCITLLNANQKKIADVKAAEKAKFFAERREPVRKAITDHLSAEIADASRDDQSILNLLGLYGKSVKVYLRILDAFNVRGLDALGYTADTVGKDHVPSDKMKFARCESNEQKCWVASAEDYFKNLNRPVRTSMTIGEFRKQFDYVIEVVVDRNSIDVSALVEKSIGEEWNQKAH